MNLTQPIKRTGGKHYLAPRIVSLMPPHIHYVEPYAGGLAVLLERDPNDERLWLPPHKGVSEVVNDLDGELINFWRVLADEEKFLEFVRRVEAIPLSRAAYEEGTRILTSEGDEGDSVQRAVAFFVTARQSRAGTFKGFTSLTRNRLRR